MVAQIWDEITSPWPKAPIFPATLLTCPPLCSSSYRSWSTRRESWPTTSRRRRTTGSARPSPPCERRAESTASAFTGKEELPRPAGTSTVARSPPGAPRSCRGPTERIETMSERWQQKMMLSCTIGVLYHSCYVLVCALEGVLLHKGSQGGEYLRAPAAAGRHVLSCLLTTFTPTVHTD